MSYRIMETALENAKKIKITNNMCTYQRDLRGQTKMVWTYQEVVNISGDAEDGHGVSWICGYGE